MAEKIVQCPNDVPCPPRDEVVTRRLVMHIVDLKDVTYEVVAQNQFNPEQHLQNTVSYMHGPVKQKERWVHKHLKV